MKKYYVDFEVIPKKSYETKRKTDKYSVFAKSDGEALGIIKWYAPWRQYCFFPENNTVWSKGCLSEVQDFLAKLMLERTKKVKA